MYHCKECNVLIYDTTAIGHNVNHTVTYVGLTQDNFEDYMVDDAIHLDALTAKEILIVRSKILKI